MFDEADRQEAPAELIRGLAVLAEPPTEEHERLAEALGLERVPTASEYSDLFLFQLYPYASVHLGPEGMMGGEARGRVAGFWKALGYEPPAEPDHLAALLGLYATLADGGGGHRKETATCPEAETATGPETGAAEADTPADVAEGRLLRQARRALLHEHLTPWLFAWLGRVREHDRGVFASWAGILETVLRVEIEVLGTAPEAGSPHAVPGTAAGGSADHEAAAARRSTAEEPLPVHLREAPPLPDPRRDGAGDFIAGLLAPVRSGMILTRADLARIASACDVGLRAGERRYALEHLLAQDAPAVLEALADEARRQAALHGERVEWIGASARFHVERARATAGLLGALAEEERAAGEPVAR